MDSLCLRRQPVCIINPSFVLAQSHGRCRPESAMYGHAGDVCQVFGSLSISFGTYVRFQSYRRQSGVLAFFQFADKDGERTFSPPIAETPFHHIALKVDQATQEEIEQHIQAAGYTAPGTFVLEHGFGHSPGSAHRSRENGASLRSVYLVAPWRHRTMRRRKLSGCSCRRAAATSSTRRHCPCHWIGRAHSISLTQYLPTLSMERVKSNPG